MEILRDQIFLCLEIEIGAGTTIPFTLNLYDNNKLHKQKNCWLLHSLYHDIGLSFDSILNIEYIWFDIKVKYQYVETL